MRRILFLFFLLIGQLAFAQTRQMSLEDAVYGRYTYLRPQYLHALQWKSAEAFTYVQNDTLWVKTTQNNSKQVLITLNEINDISSLHAQRFPRHQWLDPNRLLLMAGNRYAIVDTDKRRVISNIELPDDAENAHYSAEGNFIAYTRSNNLFVNFANGESKQITNDGGNGIVNGKTVHRNEFGINNGIFISPQGNYIAFYRKDESMVKDYPLVDFMTRQAECHPIKYPMAGLASHQVTVGVYDLKNDQTRFLQTGEPLDHYLTNIAWSPDEQHIYMAELNREQNHMQLNCYKVSDGNKEKTLFEEKSDRYVEPLHPIRFSKVNPNLFYYLTRADGWFHLYQYNTDGKLIKQITQGEWEVTRLVGFDSKETYVFVEGTLDDPLQNHIYKVHIKSGRIEKLTDATGMHSALLNEEGTAVLDRWNGPDVPAQTDLISTKSKRTLHRSPDPLEDYQLGANRLVKLKTTDGQYDLYGRLILPTNFDPQKKYPVIVYVYGGPHSQLVTKSWHHAARWWQYYMASKGYIAFTLDNRGTLNRGRDFETAIHRQLGVLETEDQMQGIAYLKNLPYVDSTRIGVHGWSYGGFMTLNLKLKHPEVFKVAVAGGPVVDWSMYEVMYGERYMDMPQENPEGYKNSNMCNYVKNLDGKLLIIHGAQDATVVMQHSMKFLRECVKEDKQVDFFTYPIHPHNVRGKDRIHLMEKVSRYFFENL